MAGNYLQTRVLTHSQKVLSLYKRAARNIESHSLYRPAIRYNVVLLRARFDENKDIKDLRVAAKLLADGEEELRQCLHPQPKIFPTSPGGILYERYPTSPDWVLDYWHPLEKAQYPEYFARRELRKKQYIEMWEKKYGKPDPSEAHAH